MKPNSPRRARSLNEKSLNWTEGRWPKYAAAYEILVVDATFRDRLTRSRRNVSKETRQASHTMATVTINRLLTEAKRRPVRRILRDIGWKGYSALLKVAGEHSMPRMVYLDGTVLLISPVVSSRTAQGTARHLRHGGRRRALTSPVYPARSTTFRRRAKTRRRGGRPDLLPRQ